MWGRNISYIYIVMQENIYVNRIKNLLIVILKQVAGQHVRKICDKKGIAIFTRTNLLLLIRYNQKFVVTKTSSL